MRLEQILKNLLSNAIKFTRKGKVVADSEEVKSDPISFKVTDTGRGIPEDKQGLIF